MIAALLLCAAATAVPEAKAEPLESYLLPGVDIRNVDITPGRWCRYRVIDEAEGFADTSNVYVAILAGESDETDTFWLEFASRPAGTGEEDRDVSRVRLSRAIRDLALGDSLYHYVDRLYTQRGTGPVEAADPRDLQRLTLTSPTSDQDWARTAGVPLETPLGSLICDRSELTIEESRRVPTGRVTIVHNRSDRFTIWSADEIPIFGLARCVIDRVRESRTLPAMPGIPQTGPRTSRVTTVVLDHGDGAEPMIRFDERQ